MSMLRMYVWGVVEPSGVTSFEDIRREIRKELKQNDMLLEAVHNWRGDYYRLIRRKQKSKRHRPVRQVLCDGNMMACCRRAVEFIDKVTLGGNHHMDTHV